MTCFHPLKAYKSGTLGASGKYGLTLNRTKSLVEGSSFSVPCGRCRGCRIDRSRQWAVRCLHESKMHPDNCFLTLTYSDKNLPLDYSINVETVQKFIRRMRKAGLRFRYFACGEYGDITGRPHYHMLMFGHDWADKKLYSKNRGNPLYTSATLSRLWEYGEAWTGTLTYQSAAYVCRYVMKKIGGDKAVDFYTRYSPVDGGYHNVTPEFALQSRMPGIGSTWFDKFKTDVFPSDFLVVDGKKHPVPRYYTKKLQEGEARKIKVKRMANANRQLEHTTPERLAVREEIAASRHSRLKRELS